MVDDYDDDDWWIMLNTRFSATIFRDPKHNKFYVSEATVFNKDLRQRMAEQLGSETAFANKKVSKEKLLKKEKEPLVPDSNAEPITLEGYTGMYFTKVTFDVYKRAGT